MYARNAVVRFRTYNDLDAAVANMSDKRAYGEMAAYHDIVAMVFSLHRV
jgi:hypothetical protein